MTFSRVSIYQTIEKGFQYIGWFNRPLSTYLYIAIFVFMFVLYFWTIRLVLKNVISRKLIWIGIIIITVILLLSYNAFSYDLFNYIFDAKIVTFYHQNPYIHKALDFPGDPMLSFMRWTHRTYPYGPLWLALTVPLSFVGNNIFIVTFYLFKLLMASFFILTVWSIEKIGKVLKFKNIMLPVVAFAFNPFVLSESLVSAHNDIVMMGFAMYGTYLLLKKDRVQGLFFYAVSIGIKFATALLAIVYFIILAFRKKNYFIIISIIFMISAVLLATLRSTFQPWYMLYVFPFASLMVEKRYIRYSLYIFSVACVLFYIPFLYNGNWDPPIPNILNTIMIFAVVLSFLVVLIFFPKSKKETN